MLYLQFMDNPKGKRPKKVVRGGVATFGVDQASATADSPNGDCPPDVDDDGMCENPHSIGKLQPPNQIDQQAAESFSKHTGGLPTSGS